MSRVQIQSIGELLRGRVLVDGKEISSVRKIAFEWEAHEVPVALITVLATSVEIDVDGADVNIEAEYWTCKCNYMNAGGICTKCGTLREALKA